MSTTKVLAGGGSAPRGRWTPADLWAFTRAWTVLLVADLGARVLPFATLDRCLSPSPPGRAPADEAAVGRLVWATAAAARHHLYPMRCLPKALCLRWLLGRHGIAAELRIGVARQEGGLAAHAWVERQGSPVGETSGVEGRFSPLRPARSGLLGRSGPRGGPSSPSMDSGGKLCASGLTRPAPPELR